MLQISFQKQFIDKILSGKKTTTMRFGIRNYHELEGKRMEAVTGNRFQGKEPFATLVVSEVEKVIVQNPFLKGDLYWFIKSGFVPYELQYEDLDKLRETEGFANQKEMDEWFVKNLFEKAELTVYEGYLIHFSVLAENPNQLPLFVNSPDYSL